MEKKSHDYTLEVWRLRAKIDELEELNKMLQKNMFHYEYRARDDRIALLKKEEECAKLEAKIAGLTAAKAEGE